MRKAQGSLNSPLLECINPRKDIWRMRFNLEAASDGSASWIEEDFTHQPSIEEIKAVYDSWSSNETARLIREGLTYGGHLVWLSQENQLNYKMIHDTAVQSGGQNLPVRIKLGPDQAPAYVTFSTISEIKTFFSAVTSHIQSCLELGWQQRDTFDLESYRLTSPST